MSLFRSSKYVVSVFASLVFSTSALLLSGCAFSGGGASGASSGAGGGVLVKKPMHGTVIGGQNPILGSVIQLYQIGQSNSSSYTANAKPLISSVLKTDAGGNFDITGLYTCTPGSYLYITAAGGDPQLSGGGGGANTSITLMASVGLCEDLPSAPFIAVNEVTTVATAYAFAQFARTTPFGTSLSGQSASASTPAFNIATSSTNLQGIANAAAMYTVLVNPIDGTSPGSNGNGALNSPLTLSGLANVGATGAVPEFWQINTIADILAACVNSAGLTSSSDTTSNCGVLFSNVLPFNGNAPADTAQAALALALNPTVPSANIAKLWGTIPSTAPFLPYVLTAVSIQDFTVGVQVKPVVPGTTTELIYEPAWTGIDSNGNVWLTQTRAVSTPASYTPSILELSPIGTPVRAGTAAGNTTANYLITNYTMGGTATTFVGQYEPKADGTYPTPAVVGKLLGAIDTQNNFWINDRGSDSVIKVPGSGPTVGTLGAVGTNPHNGGNAGDPGGSGATGTALLQGAAPVLTFVDGSDNVWTMLSGYYQGAAQTWKYGTCGSNYMYNIGIAGFLGGNPATGAYSPTVYTNGPSVVAVDPNVNDTITSNGTTTQIPGAPFFWTPASNVLNHQYTTGTTPGCATPLNQITSATAGTTKLNGQTISGTDIVYPIGASTFDVAFDSAGALWVARPAFLDPVGTTVPDAIVKINMKYGSSFIPSEAVANTTFTYFTGGGMTSTFQPRIVAIDGDGNVWSPFNAAIGISEFANDGTSLAPAGTTSTTIGYRGSVCTNCKYKGQAALTYQRSTQGPQKPAFDLSGNLWSPFGGTGGAGMLVLVGAAAPTVEPIALGLKNKTLATRP